MNKKTSIINLNSLLDLSAKLNESDSKDFIIYSTLLSLMGKLLITKAAVYMKSEVSNNYELLLSKGNFIVNFSIDDLPKEFIDLTNIKDECNFCQQGVNFIIPLILDNELKYVILLGKSLIEHNLSDDEINYITLVSNVCSNAIKNANNLNSYRVAKENAERHTQLLATLFEIGRDFSSFINREQIIKTLTLNLMGQLTVSRFAVFTIDEQNNYFEIINRFSTKFDNELLNRICNSEIANKLEDDNDISVVAPMKVKGDRKGLMLIGKKLSKGDFSDNDILFIEALGNTAIAALENERLFREEIEKKKLESELGIALEIQRNLLPQKPPKLKNFDIYGVTIPSRHVGGDYFDYIKISENKYLLAIADVSGKGIPASLIMANMQAALHLLTKSEFTLINLIQRTNYLIYNNTSADKFVTGFFCIIDDDNSTIEYLNAGHNPPYLIENDDVEMLKEGGLILGFMEKPPSYHSKTLKIGENQLIVCFTDGVNEARDIIGNEYGDDRLILLSKQNQTFSAEIIAKNIIQDVSNFVNGNTQYDDITLLIIKKIIYKKEA